MMTNQQNMSFQEKVALKGVYLITKAKLETEEHFSLQKKINELIARGEDALPLIRHLNSICKTEQFVYENIVPTVGRAMIANNLGSNSPTNVPYIKYAEVGTGTNPPSNSDTALQASTYRNQIASRTNASNTVYATAFFGATETSGTFREAGIFCDGSATQGTGVLLSRVAINVTKSTSETLTIDWTLVIT
jgi:hypothetical protein